VAGQAPEWMQSLILLILLAAAVYMMLKQAKEMKEMQEKLKRKSQVFTVIECIGDGKVTRKKRPYRDGDYVGKPVDECDTSKGYITLIYSEAPEEEGKGKKGKTTSIISRIVSLTRYSFLNSMGASRT